MIHKDPYPEMSNRVIYFEIPCDDPQKTMDFFKAAFGWTFEQFGNEPYWSAKTGSDESEGINGAVMKKRDPEQPLVNSINVTNIDRSLEEIEKAGGTIVVPKTAIPSSGWYAYFRDPDGNIHGVHQYSPGAK